MIETVYVRANSKKELNARLASDGAVQGDAFNPYGSQMRHLESLPVGTVIKIYSKYVGGNPYAKAYGNIARDKSGRVFVK